MLTNIVKSHVAYGINVKMVLIPIVNYFFIFLFQNQTSW
jgi:hypothetical protein